MSRASRLWSVVIATAAAVSAGSTVGVAQTQQARPKPPAKHRAAPTPIKYVSRGLPPRRVSAATRGEDFENLVRLLAPHDHVAQTRSGTPVLYWVYFGDSIAAKSASATLTLTGGGTAQTALLPRVQPQRAEAIDLKALGLRLE